MLASNRVDRDIVILYTLLKNGLRTDIRVGDGAQNVSTGYPYFAKLLVHLCTVAYGSSSLLCSYRLCCQCGVTMEPNPANMCVSCLRIHVDITQDIPKQGILQFCRNCERYLQPPFEWISCALESKELLGLCLRKLKALNKVKLVDAGFIWTEPHSKLIKV